MAFLGHHVPPNDHNKIYVGKLPEVTNEEFKLLFSLCGKIEGIDVQRFSQNGGYSKGFQEEKFTYGFVSFDNTASVTNALNFNDSTYKNRALLIRKAAETKYGTCVLNVPEGMPDPIIKSIFENIGPAEVHSRGNMCFVNFFKEEDRQKAVNIGNFPLEFGRLRVTKKEPQAKIVAPVAFSGEKFPVFIGNVKAGITEEDLRVMFTLCGPIHRVWLENENGCVAFLTEDGQRKALQFHDTIPNEWTEPIEISMEQAETTFSVVVTGINDDIDGKLLQEFFADAGESTVEVEGLDRAIVTFETAESRDKALEYNRTPVGMTPGRRLMVEKNTRFGH